MIKTNRVTRKGLIRMKIALVVPALTEKGPIIFTRYLIMGMKKIAESIEVFYFKGSPSIDLGVKCTKLSLFRKYSFDRFDIVHTTMAIPDIYAFLHVKKHKWVSSMHNYMEIDLGMLYGYVKSKLIVKLWKTALSKCNNIIVSSVAMKNYYMGFLGKKRYSVIPYGIEEPEYGEIDEQDERILKGFMKDNLRIIGSVGVMVKRKGFEQLISVVEQNCKLALVLVGDGPEKERLECLVKEKGIENRVLFTGFRSCSYNYYRFFDVYAHVSYSEGFGIAMLEALSKHLPLVCSRLDIYRDYFTDEDVCYFKPGDINGLMNAVNKCICKKDDYSDHSYALFKKMFNNTVMAKRHIKLYNRIKVGK